ncbi:MAG: KamA family radical SAM protein [Syntrophobacteraceae bacterium]
MQLDDLTKTWPLYLKALEQVSRRYPFRINGYFSELLRYPGDPLWRQAIPDEMELFDSQGHEDPLAEESLSPVPNLVHRYPNRVLWLISHECAVHCRFCTRKRRWNDPLPMNSDIFNEALSYIRTNKEINDVLLSGGDPLMLPVEQLEFTLKSLRSIRHVEVIRIGTRIPGVAPQTVTPYLAEMLARHHPVYMNLHFNHPSEITEDVRRACAILADKGIPLASQTVLLRSVNDEPETLKELFQKLLTIRVRPYYLMQMDLTQGTAHFRTPIGTGLRIMHSLRNHISGLSMPHFVVDLPGGYGKIPLTPNYIEKIGSENLTFINYQGKTCSYPLLPGEAEDLSRWLKQ